MTDPRPNQTPGRAARLGIGLLVLLVGALGMASAVGAGSKLGSSIGLGGPAKEFGGISARLEPPSVRRSDVARRQRAHQRRPAAVMVARVVTPAPADPVAHDIVKKKRRNERVEN
jgi:hypothetical protein